MHTGFVLGMWISDTTLATRNGFPGAEWVQNGDPGGRMGSFCKFLRPPQTQTGGWEEGACALKN